MYGMVGTKVTWNWYEQYLYIEYWNMLVWVKT